MINATDLIRYQLNRLADLYALNQKDEFCADAAAELRNWSDSIECAEVELDWNFYRTLRQNVWYLNHQAAREGLSHASVIDNESNLLIGIINTTVAALSL